MSEEELARQCRELNKQLGLWIERLQEDEKNTLELFCETVAELETYPLYLKLLRRNEVNSDVHVANGKVVKAAIRDFDENDLRAFLLGARLFGQDNERISVRRVAEIFDRRVSPRLLLWMNFNGYRLGWNEFRERRIADSQGETMGEIFDVFLYGHYAHKNRSKQAKYRDWTKHPLGLIAYRSAFLTALGTFFWAVQGMREYAQQLLAAQPFGNV